MEFEEVVDEYFWGSHAESVPPENMPKTRSEALHLPMHVVCRDTSTTTKLHVVFNALAKSSMDVLLIDQLLIGPTVHAPLLDTLMGFHHHQVALATDITGPQLPLIKWSVY